MNILAEIHRAQGIDIKGKTIHRTAVRGVILPLQSRKLLMIYSSNVGDYKFPGGGVEEGETHEPALARELLEECGVILGSINGELGAIVEYNFPVENEFDVFKMTSYYYFCSIKNGSFSEQKLDDYERDLGFRPVWIHIHDALQVNKSLLDAGASIEWLQREIWVLDYLKQNLF